MTLRSPPLSLAFSLRFKDLYDSGGLAKLDAHFLEALRHEDAGLAYRLAAARANPESLGAKPEAELLLALAPVLEDFIAKLFGIEKEVDALVSEHTALDPLFRVKRKFVQRRAMLKIKADAAAQLDGLALERELAALLGGSFEELAFARAVTGWLADEAANAPQLEIAEQYAAWAAHTPEGRARNRRVEIWLR